MRSMRIVPVAAALLFAASAAAQLDTVKIHTTNFSAPLFFTTAPGQPGRGYVVEQGSSGTGRIRIVDLSTGVVNATPFLTISGITTGGERGLLGLAFHPQFDSNGRFFVNLTNSAGDTEIREYAVGANPDVVDPNTANLVLWYDQTQANHNGGWIAFGPDGYLYNGSGDGGGAGDTPNNAQNLNLLLGKMLRIDVDGDDFPGDPNADYRIPGDNPFVGIAGRDEIWAYGLRNPWRSAFDRKTGELYIADVGQNNWEEVNVQPAESLGGENYGWKCYEGNAAFSAGTCPGGTSGLTFPVHVYSHGGGNCSITGGYVYRGCAIPWLRGSYFFADLCTNTIWSFKYTGAANPPVVNRTVDLDPANGSITSITSFGEDASGELYIVEGGGEVWKIVPQSSCVDLTGDGATNQDDLNVLLAGFGTNDAGDLDCDGDTDQGDLNLLLAGFGCL